MADKKYLQQRGNTWYVVVEVPKSLRAEGVPPRFIQSLQTASLAEANRKKHPHVAEFLRRVAALKQSHNPRAVAMRDASEWKAAREAARREEGEDSEVFHELTMQIQELSRQLAERDRDLASGFSKTALGSGTLIKDEYPSWIAEADVAGQTKDQHKAAVLRFLAWAGEFATVEDTNRRRAGEYVSELLANSGLSRQTAKRHMSSLSRLWVWLRAKGKGNVEANIWTQHELGKKPKARFRSGLSDEKLLKLLKGSYSTERYRTTLRDVLRLGLLHGARLDELCALRKRDVEKAADGYWLIVREGKTDAAARRIPVHKAAVPIVERRLKGSGEFLFEGLEPGGPDDKRSWYVSKAYGRFRDNVGVDGKGEDFHALRNTFIERMEGVGVPESTTKLLVGHSRAGSMTYGHYSAGTLVDLRSAIDRLTYSAAVMKALP